MHEPSPRRSALGRAISDPPVVPDVRDESDVAGLARRSVRGRDLWGHSVAVVAPSASALAIPFVLARLVGPGAWLSAVIGFALAFLLASTFSQFATRISAPGSMYTWVTRSLGPWAGILVGTSMIMGYGILVAFGISTTIRRSSEAVDSFTVANGEPRIGVTAQLLIGLVALAICLVVMVRGVRVSTRLAFWAEMGVLLALLLLVVLTLGREGLPGGSVLSLEGASLWKILAGASFVMGITVGFESSAGLSAEAERPFLNVPRAFFGTLTISAVLYFLGFLAANATLGDPAERGLGPAQRWFPPTVDAHLADGLVSGLLAVAFLALAMCAWNVLSRVLFSFAREGILPEALGRTHPRWNTPVVALAVVTVPAIAPALVAVAMGDPIGTVTYRLLGAAVLVLVIAYGIVALAVPVFLHSLDEVTWRPVAVAASAFVLAIVLWVVTVVEDLRDHDLLPVVLAALVPVAAATWFASLRARRRRALSGMGIHDETLRSDLLGG